LRIGRAIVWLVAAMMLLIPLGLVDADERTLTVSPDSGVPGSTVIVSGTHWSTINPPYIIFWNTIGGTPLGGFMPVGDSGVWATPVTIPSTEPPGFYNIYACEGYGGEFQECLSRPFILAAAQEPTPTPPMPIVAPTVELPTPVPSVCGDLGLGPDAEILHFEFAGGSGVLSDDWYDYNYGVSFGGSAEISEPGVAVPSGSRALKSVESEPFGSTGIPLRFVFSRGVQAIGMFVGMDGAPYTTGETAAVLHVFGYAAGEEVQTELGYSFVNFPSGETDVEHCLIFTAPEGAVISHAELDYLNQDAVGIGEPKLIDNLTLVYSEIDLPADAPPVVTINEPEPGAVYTGGRAELRVTIVDDRGLEHMRYELNDIPRYSVAYHSTGAPGEYAAVFWVSTEDMEPEADNSIQVIARDTAGQEGSAEVEVHFDPPPTLDIQIDAYEITQVIQTLHNPHYADNRVSLYAGKPTLVRVYLRADGVEHSIYGISGQLCLDGICITARDPVTVSPTDDPVSEFRGDLDRTLNFHLPLAWIGVVGEKAAVLTVNVDGADAEECCYDNNTRTIGFNMLYGSPLNVVMLRVNAHGYSTHSDDRWPGLLWVRHNYPTTQVRVYYSTDEPLDMDHNFRTREGWDDALLDVYWSNVRTSDAVDHLYYHAMIPADVPTGGIAGIGYRPGEESAALWMFGDGSAAAHEIGHNLNLRHAPCGDVANVNTRYPEYRAADGTAYPSASIGDWGIDLYTSPWELKDPASTYDFMSYCTPSWISVYSRRYLRDHIGRDIGFEPASAGGMLLAPLAQEDGDYLVGGGRISSDGFEIRHGFYVEPLLSDVRPPPDEGPFTVQLVDAAGEVLNQRAFAVLNTDKSVDQAEGSFVVMIPWRDGTAEVILLYQDAELGRVPVSANAPEVALLEPNGDETWPAEGDQIIRWEASDADGDPLTAYVQYSPDGGESWRSVRRDVTESEITVDAEVFPGSDEGLVRVCVTDGINTACDSSDATFEVAGKGPEIFLLSPGDGMVFSRGEEVVFEALATDLEDGPIEGEGQFAWHSDLDGELGEDGLFWGLPLSEGRHTITLTVEDSDGNQSQASVSIVIASQDVDDDGVICEIFGIKLTAYHIAILIFVVIVLVLMLIAWIQSRRRKRGVG
jgi:hypothetical protein